MQIRRILLFSFFLLLSVVALPLMGELLFSSKETLKNEIARSLNSNAFTLMEEVDQLMFESLQNVHSWSRLEIVQEARIGDVDKRLSQFLNDVESGYNGMYRTLFYSDTRQRVIAASAPEIIGRIHYTTARETRVLVPNGDVFVEEVQFDAPPYQDTNLVIHTPVFDHYSNEIIGQFYGLFDLQQIFNLLDKANKARADDLYIVLMDGAGRAIAASSSLRQPAFLLSTTFMDWKPGTTQDVFIRSGKPVTESSVLVGYAKSAGYRGYANMGWSILIFQDTAKAFRPLHSLWTMFGIVFILTLFLSFWAAHWISGKIANPLMALTKWVREVRLSEKLSPPQVGGTVEIQELEMAFSEVFQELERSREHVVQTAKLAVVGEMSAIMAHEIRTPLGIISTSAQWLQRERGLSPEGKEMSQFILDESARLTKLVTTLLECARPREPRMLPQNIHDLLMHCMELLGMQAEKKHLRIIKQLDAEKPMIVCDSELLTQAFLNLLLNAIQIVPNNGIVQVRTYSDRANFIGIEIADNGPGIAAEDYPRLFEPFFSKRAGGIGLGLTVTRQIVLAHHGRLSAQPSAWGGACFVLHLPIRQE